MAYGQTKGKASTHQGELFGNVDANEVIPTAGSGEPPQRWAHHGARCYETA